MTAAASRVAALIRALLLVAAAHLSPAKAMVVELTFVLPRGAGEVHGRFTGFDSNKDGWIKSADGEVVTAWSSVTGPWDAQARPATSRGSSDSLDVIFSHLRASGQGGGYVGDAFSGLARFAIETNSQANNHVNSNRLTFRGESKFGFFALHGLSWSDLYNAPSSYSYTFEGPEHQVQLALSATGSPFLPAVPEPDTFWLLAVGFAAVLQCRRRRLLPTLLTKRQMARVTPPRCKQGNV